jgi:hypothetical protein
VLDPCQKTKLNHINKNIYPFDFPYERIINELRTKNKINKKIVNVFFDL